MPGSRTLESGDPEFGGQSTSPKSERTDYWKAYKMEAGQAWWARAAAFPRWPQYSSKRYPYSSLAINDQIRAEEFIREFNEREKANDIPQLKHPRPQQRSHQRHPPRISHPARHGGG